MSLTNSKREQVRKVTPAKVTERHITWEEDINLFHAHLAQEEHEKLVSINTLRGNDNQLLIDQQLNPQKAVEDSYFPELWRMSIEDRAKRMNENTLMARIERLEASIAEIRQLLLRK